ncbi:MAG: hypothetical protein J6N22_02830 [Schwartzia sp.]|jgi:hypothetical protein|nr:hypothetical protein [Schwartzia sp. (in: firmicutes)]
MNLPVPEGMDPKRFKILLCIIGACGLMTMKGVAESFLATNDTPSPLPAKRVASEAPQHPNSLMKESNPSGKEVAPKQVASDSITALNTNNPFIDPSSLPKQSRSASHAALPSIPQTAPAPVGNVPVPAVPRQPVHPSGGGTGTKPLGVQGVLTGGKNGNMAIMSDGTVVTEGDTYQDQRIAYIGGDGVTFDNGHHLDYK